MPLTLHHPDGQVFAFEAGALCLELACGTGGEGFRARFEVLREPADAARWAAQSRFGLAPEVTEADLRALKDLREAVWAAAYAIVTGAEPAPADVATINRYAAAPGPVPRIDETGASAFAAPVTGGQLVAEVARDAVRTLGRPTRDRVRMCAGANCALIYLDTSRPGRRRWCSMQRCGNRHKVHAFRERQEATA